MVFENKLQNLEEMKTKLFYLLMAMFFAVGNLKADDRVVVRASESDISDNLNLEAVASLFGESDNLVDFERKLNDPKNEISNLDLNEDGYIDYLRVIEVENHGDHLIVIQAVLGDDLFQDVATIEMERVENSHYSVYIIGNEFIYGENFIIEPVYFHRPSICDYLFGPLYQPWRSPYYWGYYPDYYVYRKPYPAYRYWHRVNRHINSHNHYRYHDSYAHHFPPVIHNEYQRNDYGKHHPDRSFEKRNSGYKNVRELNQNRRSADSYSSRPRSVERSVPNKEYRRKESGNYGENRRSGSSSPNNGQVRQPKEQRDEMKPSQRNADGAGKSDYRREEPAQKEKSVAEPSHKMKSVERSVSNGNNQPKRSGEVKSKSNNKTESAQPRRSESKSEGKKKESKKVEKSNDSKAEKSDGNGRR